jgi:hypothetical protein
VERSRPRPRRRTPAAAAAAITLLCATVAPTGTADAQEAAIPSGTWTGYISFGWTVRFDRAAGGGFAFYNGGGPMLFESVAGSLTGAMEVRADGVVIPGRESPFGPQSAVLQMSGDIAGGAGSVQLADLRGSVSVVGFSQSFGPTTGTLTIDRIGCTVVGGAVVYPPEGIAAINQVGRFRPLTSRWTAALTDEVLLEEERRIVENVAVQLDEIAQAIRNDGAPVDRRTITRLIAEAERRVAGLSAEASCGTDWATPMVGALQNLLDAVISRPATMSTSDLEFLITSSVRAGALPTESGVLESELSSVLESRLELAITTSSRADTDAVFMAALALGDRDLAARAAAAR